MNTLNRELEVERSTIFQRSRENQGTFTHPELVQPAHNQLPNRGDSDDDIQDNEEDDDEYWNQSSSAF